MWDLLILNISKRGVVLTADEIEILKSVFHHKKYRKHQYILQQGEIAHYGSYIIKGIARKYEVDDKGQEHILSFTPEDWWTSDPYSFFTGNPTECFIDCLEDTEVLRVSSADLEMLYERVPKMNKYFRILYQNTIVAFQQRVTSYLRMSALERYQDFLKRYPQIEQRIPNHQIASYLGITPQSLSRLRKQYAEGAFPR